jgi:hypothetical protein
VKSTGLLSFIDGAIETTRYPEVAPGGIVIPIEVSLQELMITGTSFSRATLLPCEAPNPLPAIVTWFPAALVVAETSEITGAGVVVMLSETSSSVALVAGEVAYALATAPM